MSRDRDGKKGREPGKAAPSKAADDAPEDDERAEGADFMLFLSLDRMQHPARGRAGGKSGAAGRVTLSSGKVLPGRGEAVIPAGERLVFETPGGGGHGDPGLREREAILLDVRRELMSADAAKASYGVEISPPGRQQPQRRTGTW